MSTMIRVSEQTHITLRELAREVGEPMATIVAEAVALYRRERLIDAINAGYAQLRADTPAWAAEQAERALWDTTLTDGGEDY